MRYFRADFSPKAAVGGGCTQQKCGGHSSRWREMQLGKKWWKGVCYFAYHSDFSRPCCFVCSLCLFQRDTFCSEFCEHRARFQVNEVPQYEDTHHHHHHHHHGCVCPCRSDRRSDHHPVRHVGMSFRCSCRPSCPAGVPSVNVTSRSSCSSDIQSDCLLHCRSIPPYRASLRSSSR